MRPEQPKAVNNNPLFLKKNQRSERGAFFMFRY
nr:MAG TPA: hypothetical protein [Caudoviricetes sp.]